MGGTVRARRITHMISYGAGSALHLYGQVLGRVTFAERNCYKDS